jgi:hypothetical protein
VLRARKARTSFDLQPHLTGASKTSDPSGKSAADFE